VAERIATANITITILVEAIPEDVADQATGDTLVELATAAEAVVFRAAVAAGIITPITFADADRIEGVATESWGVLAL